MAPRKDSYFVPRRVPPNAKKAKDKRLLKNKPDFELRKQIMLERERQKKEERLQIMQKMEQDRLESQCQKDDLDEVDTNKVTKEEALLIECVEKYEFLYNESNPSFHNYNIKENAWKEIAEILNWSVEECKIRWSALKGMYQLAVEKRKTVNRQKRGRKKRIEKMMGFLTPSLEEGRMTSNFNLEERDDFDVDEGTQFSSGSSEIESCPTTPGSRSSLRLVTRAAGSVQPVAEALKDYFGTKLVEKNQEKTKEMSDKDTRQAALKSYFATLYHTVSTFAVPLQIEFKGKLSALVNEFELRSHQAETLIPTSNFYCALPNRQSTTTNVFIQSSPVTGTVNPASATTQQMQAAQEQFTSYTQNTSNSQSYFNNTSNVMHNVDPYTYVNSRMINNNCSR